VAIFSDPATALAGAYPHAPARLSHSLASDPLFSLAAIAGLAARLPPENVEYNAGTLPIGVDPAQTPSNGLSIDETIRRIEQCKSWMALKHVEADAAYREALERALSEIAPAIQATSGAMHVRVGFIFISSPESVTPFHMDPEHNILMQISGSKRFYLFPSHPDIVSDEQHELYHAGAAHRNLAYRPEFAERAVAHDLAPGDALYVPVKAPHWVRNGPDPSISFSITWRSRVSDREARLRLANHRLRRLGLSPPAPGARPIRDNAAILAERIRARLSRAFGA